MFQRWRQRFNIPTTSHSSLNGNIQTAMQGFDEPQHQAQLRELKQLVSATPEHFQMYYGEAIQRVAGFFQILPHPTLKTYGGPHGLLDFSLALAVTALKFRRGYMLPIGAETETCYREQELWTYAVFTCALFAESYRMVTDFDIDNEDEWRLSNPAYPTEAFRFQKKANPLPLGRRINGLLIPRLFFPQGLDWLMGEPHVFCQWWSTLTDDGLVKPNVLQEILEKAQSALGYTPFAPCSNTSQPSTTEIATQENQKEKGMPAPTLPQEEKPEGNNHLSNDSSKTLNNSLSLADRLLNALKQHHQAGQLSLNQNNSFCHRVPEGWLLIMPDTWQWFVVQASQETSEWLLPPLKTWSSDVLSRLTSDEHFIKHPTQNTFLHRYYRGDWQDRDSRVGLLVSLETWGEFLPSLTPASEFLPDPLL